MYKFNFVFYLLKSFWRKSAQINFKHIFLQKEKKNKQHEVVIVAFGVELPVLNFKFVVISNTTSGNKIFVK